jgi:hypothetical protein
MERPRGNNRQCYNLKMTPNRLLESIQEWSTFMKTSNTWSFRSIVGKIMMGLVLAAMIGSIDVAPALGKDKGGKHDNARYEQRGRGHDRGHYVYERGRRVYRPYGYREQVYVPPRVIYAPPSPPGISIFFPPIFIHP